MNAFESTLVAALRDEAQEIAMSADLNEGRDILESRLDDVDRGRRRRQIVGGLTVAAAVVAIVGVAVLQRPSTAAPPVTGPLPTSASPSPTQSSSTPSPQGVWTATVSDEQIGRTLTAAGLGDQTATLLEDAFGFPAPGGTPPAVTSWTLQLYVDSVYGTLYVVPDAGDPVMLDRFAYEIGDGPSISTTTGDGDGAMEYADYSLFLQPDLMRLGWIRGSVSGAASFNEAANRALYTTSDWTR